MFCRVTYAQAPEGKTEKGLSLWYDEILPITRAREGFKGALSMVNRENGKALSVTFWEGEESMLASTEAEYHKKAIARFGEFFENAHEPENFELHLFIGDVFNGTFAVDEMGRKLAEVDESESAKKPAEA